MLLVLLRKLGELRDSELITEDEFNAKEAHLLEQMATD
jgi:Short C-terminal domain